MLVPIIFVVLLTQSIYATFDCKKCAWSKPLGKVCAKTKWWDPCLGCDSLGGASGGGLLASKLGGVAGGICPSLSAASFAKPSYLPILSASTSQVPVFKSYFKPIFKTHFTKVPILQHGLKALINKYPCLKKIYGFPAVGGGNLGCLKSKCCRPLCSFC